ncbi:MAG: hypothetical protein P9F75_18065 [Candidatus Contendobacter sp.]|nr:hypothetical protein [Candidatus Contendobacter sp.]
MRRGVQFSAAGVLLVARTVEPLAVLLPTDWLAGRRWRTYPGVM